MLIEIFADNLIKKDIVKNHIKKYLRVIIIKNNKVLLEKDDTVDTYKFPGVNVLADQDNLQSLKNKIQSIVKLEVSSLKETISVIEHFPGTTYENRYFLYNIIDQEYKKKELEKRYIWLDLLDALNLFETYDSNTDKGYQILSREFIALTNSV